VEYRPESFTISVPVSNVSEWIKQKQRHLSTGRYYRARDKFLLISEPFSRILFYLLSVLLICYRYNWQTIVPAAGAILILKGTAMELSRRRFGEKNIVLFSLFFDIFSPLINLSLYVTAIRNRPGKMAWK
jgi:hypothetical protein